MSTPTPKLVLDCRASVGEGPLWHKQTQTVWFTDILGKSITQFDPRTGKHTHFDRPGCVGGFTFEADGSAILLEEQNVIHRANDGKTRVLCKITEGNPERFNDCIADPEGRIYVGASSSKGEGALIRIERGGKATVMVDGVSIGNGMGFTSDLKKFYFTDSRPQNIYVFDYDRKTGNLGNRRVFAHIKEKDELPDGMTVDAEDHVWSAIWGGFGLIRFRPDGSVERRLRFPAKQTSCVTFGGPDLTDMYITSACHSLDDLPSDQRGGGLFHLNVGIRGRPEFPSRLVS